MTQRGLIAIASMLALLVLCGGRATTAAYAQAPPASSEPSNDAERALVASHPKEWDQLNPEQRQRVLENYRRWQSMAPEERQKVGRSNAVTK